jgi:CheY-like chemotaxis protein
MNTVTDRQKTMKVLIVDDNAEMRRLLRVYIVTDYDLPEWREAAQATGASGYVLKEELHIVRGLLRAQEEL